MLLPRAEEALPPGECRPCPHLAEGSGRAGWPLTGLWERSSALVVRVAAPVLPGTVGSAGR